MSTKAVIEIGNQPTTELLFTYPNDGHADQSLQETVEHYFNDSIRREGLAFFKLAAEITPDRCAVTITLDDQATAKEIAARYQGFFDNGKTGLQAADAFRASGKWDGKWQFLLPLGVPIAFAKAIEIMDFPPLTLIKNQDYLKSKTTSRWWELLMLNGVTDDEKARYSCILDIVPVAAPASDGEKLRLSGIYDGPFDSYGMPLLELLVRTQAAQYRPLIALGLPIRVWITRLWNLTLKVMDTGTITLHNGATCNVIATNHPSFFYYAVNSNIGPGAADKNLAAGLAVMKQDIVCAAWHAEMGRSPGGDPKAVFKMSADKWKDRDAELLELVKKQAGIPKIPEAKEVSLAAIKPLMPSAEQLEELERQFYASNAQHPAEEDAESLSSGRRVTSGRVAAEIDRLETQLQRSFDGGAWHGPALLEVLDGFTHEEAFAHPIAGAHSVWEIVLHLIGTYDLVLRRLNGDTAPLTPAEDWPVVPAATPSAWQDSLHALRRANDELRRRVLAFNPDALDAPLVPEPAFSAYTQFIGITQHDLYHAGQIVLLKRALRTNQ